MKNPLDIEIRNKLASYLVGEVSLSDFEDWFVPSSWNVVHSGNQSAINLVYEIELWLAEFSDGFWNEEELKRNLRPLVQNYQINMAPIFFGVEQPNVKLFQFASFDIQYEVVSS